MGNSLRAEFKKMLTIRSTYVLIGIVLVLSAIGSFANTQKVFIPPPETPQVQQSPKAATSSKTEKQPSNTPKKQQGYFSTTLEKTKLEDNIMGTVNGATIFICLAVILLMGHEYRYNIISYTLTHSKSRSRVLTAKLITSLVYLLAVMTLAMLATIVFTYLAVSMKNLQMPAQDIDWFSVFRRSYLYISANGLFGLAAMTIFKNMIAGIVSLFALPTVNSIIGNILGSHNIDAAKWLPYSALDRVSQGASPIQPGGVDTASTGYAFVVLLVYLILFWTVAWISFTRRDAN